MGTATAFAETTNSNSPGANHELRAAVPYLTLLVLVQVSLAMILVLSAA